MKKLLSLLLILSLLTLSLFSCKKGDPEGSTTRPDAGTVFDPADVGHTVYGEGYGILPGRVVWAQDFALFDWTDTRYYWDEQNFDTAVARQMVKDTICAVSGQVTERKAWRTLFEDLNTRRYGKAAGYTQGESIAIKLNMNAVSTNALTTNAVIPTPCVLRALLSSLVTYGGVLPEDIVLYDVTRVIPTYLRDYIAKDELAGIRFVYAGQAGSEKDTAAKIEWSSEVVGDDAFLPTCVSEATYLINYANMKMHTLAGVTVTAKNHFGSIVTDKRPNNAPESAGLHELVCATQLTYEGRVIYPRPYGSYNPLADIIAHADVGQKTLLYFVDAVVTTAGQSARLSQGARWSTMDGRFPCSILASQDPIAIDSVCYDLLASEPNMRVVLDAPSDNYLIEAATAPNPPSGTVYRDGRGNIITKSLGVHEHWYDAETKEYSRNKGAEEGIELYRITYN